MNINHKKAVVLLSGGMDSATTLAIAVHDGFEVCTMSFKYGQRHSNELTAAQRIADRYKIEKRVLITIDLRLFGGSALTSDLEVPKSRSAGEIAQGIPITYVPARNTIFLSYALGWAEVIGSHDIFIGVNAVDYSGYPDCRPEFINAFQNMANLATKEGVEGHKITIHTPLINLSKAEIIKTGSGLGVDFASTFSCYDPSPEGFSCGECDSCQLRKKGFREAGVEDPTRYGCI